MGKKEEKREKRREKKEKGRRGEKDERERGGRQGCLKQRREVHWVYVTVKVGTFPKKVANFSASMVADVTISFMSFRRDTTWGKIKLGILCSIPTLYYNAWYTIIYCMVYCSIL